MMNENLFEHSQAIVSGGAISAVQSAIDINGFRIQDNLDKEASHHKMNTTGEAHFYGNKAVLSMQ
jgi:predicted outer membrane repeat protein